MKVVKPENCGADGAISILGIPFDRVDVKAAIERIEQMIAARKPHYLVTANVDFLVQARADIELRRILLDAHLVLCDGTPLLWASRLLGNALPERVAGSDLAPLLLKVAAEKDYKVFLLGATPESARKAMDRLRDQHPSLLIEHYSPPFHRLLEMDHEEIRRRILSARPDILLVSFGCPKQEKWIAMHYRELGVPVSIGVGATIDFLAGMVRRAPVWMQRSGTEWVYRLLQEPRRLAGRYSKDLWVFGTTFLAQVALERRGGRLAKTPTLQIQSAGSPASTAGLQVLRLPRSFDKQAFASGARTFLSASPDSTGWNVDDGRHCFLDAAGVARIDSTGLAMLVRWQAAVRVKGAVLVLVNPSPAILSALSFARLLDFFPIAKSIAAAEELLQQCIRQQSVSESRQGQVLTISWRGEVMAASSKNFWEATTEILERHCFDGAVERLNLDMSGVPFLDSTGLGLLIRLRKTAEKQNAEFSVTGMQPAVLNVIKLARLESLFTNPGKNESRRLWPLPRRVPQTAPRSS
jgi:N-acetylglucosaminyldiphosphoundecaprenol N-acetyl-beta-D-mannosaminyltransferase